jgi:hypothetical protein
MTLEQWENELDRTKWDPTFEVGAPQLSAYLLDLKNALQSTDYMVIKCYEAQLAGIEMPYDLQRLLALRNTWRNSIEQVEFEISMLG